MAEKLFLEVVYGDKRFKVADASVLSYASKHRGSFEDSLNAALICGVQAIGVAGASKEVLALEAQLAAVQARMSGMTEEAVSNLGELLAKTADPKSAGSMAGAVAGALQEQAKLILRDLDPQNPDSAFGRLASELRGTVREMGQSVAKDEVRKELGTKLASKGRDFEEAVTAALAECSVAYSDVVESTGDEVGLGTSKKGDAIIRCSGPHPVAIVVEAKRKKVALTTRFIEDELRAGMSNRGATAAILVVHPEYASSVGAPVKIVADNIVACVYDPESDDNTAIQIAYTITRAWAMRENQAGGVVDAARVGRRLTELGAKIEQISVVERSFSQSIDDLDRSRTGLSDIRRSLLRESRDIARDLLGEGESSVVLEDFSLPPTAPTIEKGERIESPKVAGADSPVVADVEVVSPAPRKKTEIPDF